VLESHQKYDRQNEYINDGIDRIDDFLHHYYTPAPKSKINYDFTWHGLMGYTANGIRLIGPSSENPNLLYNLGCNGIGILPSIYGGFKISQFLLNVTQAPSIFDPK
jgi:glycine/D-amino acid oxidase-like deaminating enzyme